MYWEVAYYYDKPFPFELRSAPSFSISFRRLLSAHGFVHMALCTWLPFLIGVFWCAV